MCILFELVLLDLFASISRWANLTRSSPSNSLVVNIVEFRIFDGNFCLKYCDTSLVLSLAFVVLGYSAVRMAISLKYVSRRFDEPDVMVIFSNDLCRSTGVWFACVSNSFLKSST